LVINKMREKSKATTQAVQDIELKGHKLLPFTLKNRDEVSTSILKIKEIIDETTDSIFVLFKKELLSNHITYIIPAVWGKLRQRELNRDQRNIYRTIETMVSDVLEIMEFDELGEAQRFAIEYLIRGLVISKITYLIASNRTDG
jgi:hypothetical protein